VFPRGSEPRNSWLSPVLFVTAFHLLSTSGGWWITDHGEILAVAHRLLSAGHYDLRDLGPGFEDWTRIAEARGSFETRFLPLSVLVLTPLLALDRLFGWGDPSSFHFVYLQGHLLVSAGLAMIGRFCRRSSGSASATAVGLMSLGFSWPVWMIARRLGPEPVLFLLLCLFGTGGRWARMGVLVALPWVHASGALLGLGALLWSRFETRTPSGLNLLQGGLAWLAGAGSVAVLWNLPVHGQLLMGGYSAYLADPFFKIQNPLYGVVAQVGPMLFWTVPLWIPALRSPSGVLRPSLALWFPFVTFLSLFSNTEPERRLSPLLGLWAITLLPAAEAVKGKTAMALSALALALGLLGLSTDFVDSFPTPIGVYSGPLLLIPRLAFVAHRPWMAAGLLGLILIVLWRSGAATLGQILERTRQARAPETAEKSTR